MVISHLKSTIYPFFFKKGEGAEIYNATNGKLRIISKMIMTNNKTVSFQGCYNQLQSKFESYLYILIGIAAGVGLLQVRVLSHHNSKLHVVL